MTGLPTLATFPSSPGNVVELGPLTIHYYGIAIALGVIAAVVLARRRYAGVGGDPELVDRTAVWAVVAGIAGARLGFVTTNFHRFVDRPHEILYIWQGGLAFYGGLILAVAVVLLYLHRQRANVPAVLDAIVPGLPLAQAIGRWGNYFNEELYGTPTDLPWALEVSHEPVTVHPTFLYESLGNLVIVVALIAIGGTRRLRRGSLLFVYLIGYGVLRFGMELLRTDTEFRLLGLSRNGWGSLGALLLGVVVLVWWQRRSGPSTDTPLEPGEPGAAKPSDEATDREAPERRR